MRDLGPLGRRLLGAFIVVALVSVGMVTVAALIGSQRGIDASTSRQQIAEQVAATAGDAYAQAGGWKDADLQPTIAYAEDNGARVQVFDDAGDPLISTMGMGRMTGGYEQPVVVDGADVGVVRVGFGGSVADTGRGIAWSWILIATAIALVVAVVAGWWVTRQITRPITQLTEAAAAFAAGERDSRADIDSPGEIGELARTFDHAADTIAREEQLRRNLSADVAHELRTPLTALLAGLEEVRDGLMPADEQTLTRLHDQAVRLQRVVTDLAALAAAEAASPTAEVRHIDLAEIASRASEASAAQLRVAGVELRQENDHPVYVTADPDRVAQVVGNLLANAARYCRAGDTVVVRTYTNGQASVLEVADTGPGVAPEDLEHVFERFWRGSSAVGGSGIGLAVVRELVRAQGGSVEADSDGSSGLTVRVRFPPASATAVP